MLQQRQSDGDCLLLAACNATDTDVNLIYDLLNETGRTWLEILDYDKDAVVDILELIQPGLDRERALRVIWGGHKIALLIVRDTLLGRGILVVRDMTSPRRHALAYEDGVIVDSNVPELLLLSTTAACIHMWRHYDGIWVVEDLIPFTPPTKPA